MTITFVSLFSGIGGFDLGLEQAGMECILQCEIEKNCLELLGNKWPNVEKVKDVREIKRTSADLICGGFPCQDVSVAGKRAGLAGKRSGLWHEFHRIIERNLPRWVVIENVSGLLSSNEGRDFATILRGLVGCGYGVSWRILDAQYFGLAQRRKRVFIVGSLGSGRSAQVLFESEGMSGDTPPSREAGARIAATIGASTPSRRNGGSSPTEGHLISPTLHTGLGHHRWSIGNQDWRLLQPVAFDWQSGGDNRMSIGLPNLQANQTPAVAWQQNTRDEVQLIGGDGDIAGALSAEAGMKQKNYVGVRRLTPTECIRLQGFPDGWTEGFSDSVRYRMLGNAVAVPVAEWIGRRILEAEQS